METLNKPFSKLTLEKEPLYLRIVIVLFHIIALAALFVYGLHWLFFAYLIMLPAGLGVTLGSHRYFTHHAFETSPFFECILLWLGHLSGFKVIQWVYNHRIHHHYADSAFDLHSPLHGGFWWSHFQWAFYKIPLQNEYIKDILANPRVAWFDKYWWIPAFSFLLLILSCFYFSLGLPGFLQGIGVYCLGIILLWHIEGSVNSITHLWGTRPFNTKDNARNNFLVAVLSMGEGWHNNHHFSASSARLGFHWYQIDLTYYVVWTLEKLHIIWNVKLPKALV